jgi:inactivated superfamily I helicase
MKILHVYPTSRAIRTARDAWQDTDALIPTLMRMDEFEQRCVSLGERALIDPLQRVLLLREASDFSDFEVFKVDRTLVRFIARSEGIFRFFEEMGREEVDFIRLAEADAYAEFGSHLLILAQLKNRYATLLERRGLTDTMFIPESGRFRPGFVAQYDRIELFLEGLLSRYELKLLMQVAEQTELIVHYTASPYSTKMEARLAALGVTLPQHAHTVFDLGQGTILEKAPAQTDVTANVVAVSERFEQIAEAFVQIQRMVDGGIAAERIALILPDESLKEVFRLYDKLNNLNFAMGFDYTNGRSYKILEALARHWRLPDATTQERLERYGVGEEMLGAVSASGRVDVEGFFAHIDRLELREKDPLRIARVAEAREEFVRLFPVLKLAMSEWLHLWLQMLGSIRIDDLRGGLVTVMGVLETRGVAYDGVVIVDFNDGIVPATTAKDQFLNSQVRAFADLPTRSDREALQKH